MSAKKLMKASQWAKREFVKGSEPSTQTIKKWIETGTISGRIINGISYVFNSEQVGVDDRITHIVKDLMRL